MDDACHNSLQRIQDTEVLLIDEISMMSMMAFETVEDVLRKAKKNNATFGGLQVGPNSLCTMIVYLQIYNACMQVYAIYI